MDLGIDPAWILKALVILFTVKFMWIRTILDNKKDRTMWHPAGTFGACFWVKGMAGRNPLNTFLHTTTGKVVEYNAMSSDISGKEWYQQYSKNKDDVKFLGYGVVNTVSGVSQLRKKDDPDPAGTHAWYRAHLHGMS